MTNDPRYSPPPPQQQPGYRTAPTQPAGSAYARGQQHPYNQQYDWRYSQSRPSPTVQYRRPHDPFGGGGPGAVPGGAGAGPIPGRHK